MKACTKCGVEKPLASFHRRGKGRRSSCALCDSIRQKAHRLKYRQKIVESNLRWREENPNYFKEWRKSNPEYFDNWKKLNPSKMGEYIKKWRKGNRKKVACHESILNALVSGDVKKPCTCEACGNTGILHGHHCDYDKPLEVMWLCPKCHKAWHTKHGEGLNGHYKGE